VKARDYRAGNADLALTLVMQELGSMACDKGHFRKDDALYEGVLPPTWKHLEDKELVRFLDPRLFKMTGKGWLPCRSLDRLSDSREK